MRDNLNAFAKTKKSTKLLFVPIEKEVKQIDKGDNESVVAISYKIKFIDSARFMASSLSKLVNYLAEGIGKIKCKDCHCFFEYKTVKNNLIYI